MYQSMFLLLYSCSIIAAATEQSLNNGSGRFTSSPLFYILTFIILVLAAIGLFVLIKCCIDGGYPNLTLPRKANNLQNRKNTTRTSSRGGFRSRFGTSLVPLTSLLRGGFGRRTTDRFGTSFGTPKGGTTVTTEAFRTSPRTRS